MISYTNLLTNFQQITSDYSRNAEGSPPDLTFVSWLPFFHDLGLILGVCADSGRSPRRAHEPDVVPATAGPLDAVAGDLPVRIYGGAELRFRRGDPKDHRR